MRDRRSPPDGVFPADARKRDMYDGMPHDMGGHAGSPVKVIEASMYEHSAMRDAPAQTHNRHGGNVFVEVGKSGARPVGSR